MDCHGSSVRPDGKSFDLGLTFLLMGVYVSGFEYCCFHVHLCASILRLLWYRLMQIPGLKCLTFVNSIFINVGNSCAKLGIWLGSYAHKDITLYLSWETTCLIVVFIGQSSSQIWFCFGGTETGYQVSCPRAIRTEFGSHCIPGGGRLDHGRCLLKHWQPDNVYSFPSYSLLFK